MKRILLTIVLGISLTVFNFTGMASAAIFNKANGVLMATTTASSTTCTTTATKCCPKGASSAQDLGTCAQCETSGGCVDPVTDPAASTTCSQSNCNLVTSYLNPLINMLAALVGVACVISIIMAGIQYTTSAGDSGKAAAARARITTTIIAFIAFIFLYTFLQFIVPGGILKK